MSKIQYTVRLLFLSALVALLAGLGGPFALAEEKLRLSTASKTVAHYNLAALAAEEQGFWKQQGLEVKWFPFASGSRAFRAMAAGAIDLALSESGSTIQAVARGVPIVIVADLKFKQHFALWVRVDSPMRRPQDLKGANIGMGRSGGASHAYARLITKGLGLEKEVRFVSVGGSKARAAALRSKSADAVVTTLDAIVNLVTRGEIRELVSTKPFLPEKWTSVLVGAHNKFMQEKPKAIRKANRAIFQSTDFLMSNREWCLEKMKSLGYSRKSAVLIYSTLKFGKTGTIDPAVLQSIINFLLDHGIISKEKLPAMDKLYTNRFLP